MKNLAATEMDIGLFYFKAKKYKAAMYRFIGVVTNYPGLGFDLEAQDYIAKCRDLMTKASEPAPHLTFFKKLWRSLKGNTSELATSPAKETGPDPYTAD